MSYTCKVRGALKILDLPILSLVIRLTTAISAFFSISFTYRTLGNYNFGIWTSLYVLVSIGQIFDSYISIPARREISLAQAHNPVDLPNVRLKILRLVPKFILLLTAIFPFLCFFLFHLVIRQDRWDFYIVALNVFVSLAIISVSNANLRMLEGLGAFRLALFIPLMGSFTLLLFTFISFRLQLGLVGISLANTLSFIPPTILFWNIVKRKSQSKGFQNNSSVRRPKSRVNPYLMIIALSIFIAYSIDTWIVQSILGSTKVTEFNLHYRLYVVMITFATALTPVLWRSHSIDEQSRSAILKKSTYLSIATFIVGLLIWPVAREIIPFLSDNEVQINNSIYSCFLLLSIIFSFQVVVSSALLDNRGISIQAITTALMAFFNLLLSIELTNKFGIVGPIFGSILSLLFCQTIPLIFFLKPSLSKVETG